MSTFQKASRKKAKLRAAICGPAGAGKTYSALLLAQGLGKKIAMIDTERGSGELYSTLCDYDIAQIGAPYTPQKYIALLKEASKEYDVVIIDSLSHAWSGEGGVLDMHTDATAAQRTKNSYTAWRDVTPQHNALVEAILTAPCHVICCMRSKMAYEQAEGSSGKKSVTKLGMAPIQREGMEYEFTLVLDVNQEHYAVSSKDRTRLWEARGEQITVEHGRELLDWLESGIDASKEPTIGAGSGKHKSVESTIAKLGLSREGVKTWCSRKLSVSHFPDLTEKKYGELMQTLPVLAFKKLEKQLGAMSQEELGELIKSPPEWLNEPEMLKYRDRIIEGADLLMASPEAESEAKQEPAPATEKEKKYYSYEEAASLANLGGSPDEPESNG